MQRVQRLPSESSPTSFGTGCSISERIASARSSGSASNSGATSRARMRRWGCSRPYDLTMPWAPAPSGLNRWPPVPCLPSRADTEHTRPPSRAANLESTARKTPKSPWQTIWVCCWLVTSAQAIPASVHGAMWMMPEISNSASRSSSCERWSSLPGSIRMMSTPSLFSTFTLVTTLGSSISRTASIPASSSRLQSASATPQESSVTMMCEPAKFSGCLGPLSASSTSTCQRRTVEASGSAERVDSGSGSAGGGDSGAPASEVDSGVGAGVGEVSGLDEELPIELT